MRAVVGLGNPGAQYAATRHNAGFMVVERLARRWGTAFEPQRGVLRMARACRGGQAVLLIEPLMFMNSSGEALARLDPGLGVAANECVVVHDDLDLVCGRVAVKQSGGSGGHRGLESIMGCYGPEFVRVRVGIGPRPGDQDAVSFVLQPFASEEAALIDAAIQRAGDAVETIIADGVVQAMNRFNARSGTTGPMSAG